MNGFKITTKSGKRRHKLTSAWLKIRQCGSFFENYPGKSWHFETTKWLRNPGF